MKKYFDIVIIGGGMVGASLACALLPVGGKEKFRIAVIEASPASDPYQPSYDSRATALAYGSRTLYENMGIWEQLKPHLTEIKQIQVTDKGYFGSTTLKAEQEKVPALGYIVENQWLGEVLTSRIQQPDADNIELFCPAEVTTVKQSDGEMEVTIKQDDYSFPISCELVVMADGGRSELREKMGINYNSTTYNQHAIIANISLDRPHEYIAYERFTDTGPLALLPLEDSEDQPRSALVWTVPNEQVDEIMNLADSAFLARLHDRFGYAAGNFTKVGCRHSYPLKLSLAEEQVRQGLVILGNAAHALHPIAGQGYNLALRGAVALAEQLIKVRKQQVNLGDLSNLQQFHARQKFDQQRTIGFSDKTMKLFSNNNPLLAISRNVGLQLLGACPPARKLFARSAMGLDIPAPTLK